VPAELSTPSCTTPPPMDAGHDSGSPVQGSDPGAWLL
jgi:hypothetical protein